MEMSVQRTTCNVMVDHLQSRDTPWRQCASHVKVRGTSSKMDVYVLTFMTLTLSGLAFSVIGLARGGVRGLDAKDQG